MATCALVSCQMNAEQTPKSEEIIADTVVMPSNPQPQKELQFQHLPEDVRKRLQPEFEAFAVMAKEIEKKEMEYFRKNNGKSWWSAGDYTTGLAAEILKMKQEYMDKLENTAAYKEIEDWSHKESLRLFALREIETSDSSYAEKVSKAKTLIDEDPESAARLFLRMGSCFTIWDFQSSVLYEEFGAPTYSPAELEPDANYD